MSAMRQERLTFPGASGTRLAARLDRPAAEPGAYVLFAHCFTCSKDLKGAYWISHALAEAGFGVLRFDFTGLGESEGDFADTNFSSNLDDLVAAADFLRESYAAPQLLVGHSLGGAAVLAGASRVPEARAVATIGAPSDTAHLGERLGGLAPELAERGEAELRLAGRRIRIKSQLVEDLERHTLEQAIGSLGRALLIMHSPVDEIVGIEHAARIYQAARHPKSFVSLDDADHLLIRSESDARYAAAVLAAWSARYLSAAPETADEPAPHGRVRVTGGPSGFEQTITAGPHALVADEPKSVGGTDRGPNPYDLLLAALGACTSMTLRMYANRKGWPLEGVTVDLSHDRIHAADCEDCRTEEGLVDVIRRAIAVRGELDDAQRARLFEIADRCPVHRTLTNEIKIRTSREALES